jgi:hypothetical protein
MRIYPCRRSRQRGDRDDSKPAASPCHSADCEALNFPVSFTAAEEPTTTLL